jgi:hypothetical protein
MKPLVPPKPLDEILDAIGHEITFNSFSKERDYKAFIEPRRRVLEYVSDAEKQAGNIRDERLQRNAWFVLNRVRRQFPDSYLILEEQYKEWVIANEFVGAELVDLADMIRADRAVAKAKPIRKPLGKIPALVFDHLLTLPEHKALNGPEILKWMADEHGIFKTERDLYKEILPPIKPFGLRNDPRIGYSIPLAARPTK